MLKCLTIAHKGVTPRLRQLYLYPTNYTFKIVSTSTSFHSTIGILCSPRPPPPPPFDPPNGQSTKLILILCAILKKLNHLLKFNQTPYDIVVRCQHKNRLKAVCFEGEKVISVYFKSHSCLIMLALMFSIYFVKYKLFFNA